MSQGKTVVAKRKHTKLKYTILFLTFFMSAKLPAQDFSFNCKVIDSETKEKLIWCKIIVNNETEISSDTNGCFNTKIITKKIGMLDFRKMGYYTLKIKIISINDSNRLDTVALAQINVGDDYFYTVRHGKRARSIDRKRRAEEKKEMKKQSSQAYVIYKGNIIFATNGLVKLK